MRKLTALVLFGLIALLLQPFSAHSGDLGALVRLDKQTPNQSTGGTICATPETAATETSLQIIFPTGMSVNSSASNWTVTTSNLPENSTPMPGIDTATSVSSQTVTFPISDLAVGTTYCFHFASSNTLTTSSSTGNFAGTLRTRNVSNTTIDTRGFAVAIVGNNSITVSATVPANPTDFSADLVMSDPDNNQLHRENTTLTYTLTYGSNLSYPSSITVQAEWGRGTIQGLGSPTEDVVSYVVGSASDGYNGAEPVIDTVNRTISWEIPSFPANTTGQTVTFKLKTYDDYTGSQPVNFSVNGRVLGPGTQTVDSTVDSQYKFSSQITPTPTPTCVPSKCPTPIPSATPTPTPVPPATLIESIDVRTISSNSVSIAVSSNNPVQARIVYGTRKNQLNQSLSFPARSRFHLMTLEDLEPQTRYYFRITLTDQYRRVVASDLYVVDTASESQPSQAQIDSIIITSNDVVLTDPLRKSGTVPRIVLPPNTPFAFKFAVTDYENVKSITATVRDGYVLGLNNNTSYAATRGLTITEIAPGQYIGLLTTTPFGGTYELVLRISDYSGNILEQLASIVKVTDALKVVNARTKKGVEAAKVTLYFYNERLKTFELLSSAITPIKNPTYTEPDGTTSIVLPEGSYRTEVEVLGYKGKTVEFSINPDGTNYPVIELEPEAPNPITYLKYTAATFGDVTDLLQNFIHTLRISNRFFDLIAFIGLSVATLLLYLTTSRRLAVPIRHLPYFALYHLMHFTRKPKNDFLVHGKVVVEGVEEVISGAVIYLYSLNGQLLAHVPTNVDGEFFAHIKTQEAAKINVIKKGFRTVSIKVNKASLNEKHTIALQMIKKPKGLTLGSVLWYISFVGGSLFEMILVLLLIIELLFLMEFGAVKVLPFLILTIFNILLWAFHVRHTKSVG